jgi:DNA-binding NarL/FixJ family response regulator
MSDTTNTSHPLSAAASSAVTRVAVIEDHREYRDYLTALLNGSEGFHCAGSFRSMKEALERLPGDPPGAALVDIGLPGIDGVEGVRLLKERYPEMKLLMLTAYEDDERIFAALCAGASGYLLKKTAPARLLEGLQEAIAGGAPLSPEVARRVMKLFHEIRPPSHADYQLTPHELRILTLLAEGHNYATAALELHVTASTINFHLQSIYTKLQVHSKTEAVAKALRQRLI